MALSQGPGLTSPWGKALLWSNWNADPELAPIFRHTPAKLLVSDLWQLLHFLERAQDETAAENTHRSWAELDQDFRAEIWTFANKRPSQCKPLQNPCLTGADLGPTRLHLLTAVQSSLRNTFN